MQLSHFSPMVQGEWRLTLPIVCDDGIVRSVKIEEYVEGFVAFLTKGDGKVYTDNKPYKTSRKAINAAATW